MGTSTVHRSPASPHWRLVNNLYRNPSVAPERLLAEVFRASEEPYVAGLSGPESSHGVTLLLGALGQQRATVTVSSALAMSRDLLARSRGTALHEGWSLFYGDLANRALHATILSAAPESASFRAPANIVRTFLGYLVATCIDHVVSRDLSAHYGEVVIHDASTALKLSATMKRVARNIASSPELSTAIEQAARDPQARWPEVVATAWRIGAAGRPELRKDRG
jgi:hypothetical protein